MVAILNEEWEKEKHTLYFEGKFSSRAEKFVLITIGFFGRM